MSLGKQESMNITSINPQGFGAELLERSNPSAPPNPTLNSGDGQSNGASASPQAANGQVPPSGVAPWQRAGAQNLPPDDPTSRARAARYENLMANDGLRQRGREERRRLREEAKKKAAEEREKKRIEDLNTTAKKMFWLGIPGLPMVWLIMLIYFWKEFREPDKNEIIKKCRCRSS